MLAQSVQNLVTALRYKVPAATRNRNEDVSRVTVTTAARQRALTVAP